MMNPVTDIGNGMGTETGDITGPADFELLTDVKTGGLCKTAFANRTVATN
jgi:hypothetical protein